MSALPAFQGRPQTGRVGWADFRHECDRIGSHFFSPDAMHFFKSRTVGEPRWIVCPETGIRLVGFITSERDAAAWGGKRRYSVRGFNPSTGRFKHVGSFFGQFKSAAGARAYLDSFTQFR